jgi:rare lipoprotein A
LSRRLRLAGIAVSLVLATACASRTPPPVSRPIPPEDVTPEWSEEGLASWYGGGDGFDGKPTASGEIFDGALLTAAHRDLPLGTVVNVTNLATGATVRVRINDRGPFVRGRIIDLSESAARRVGVVGPGTAKVRLTLAAPAPVPALSAAAVSPTGGWAVQVGSFAERDRADRHAERLRAAGFDVYLEPFNGLTRVKVGPVDSREDAQEKLTQVEAAGFEGVVMPR